MFSTIELGRNKLIALNKIYSGSDVSKTYDLADFYLNRGYETDYRKAADLLRSVADKFPRASARLGRLYMDGRGVPQDYNQALNFLRKVNKKGYYLHVITY